MSCPLDPKVLPKIFSFDSSPGRAIAQALGNLDEKSYQSELKEILPGGDEVYEVSMRRMETESSPGPHPLQKVGVLTYSLPRWMERSPLARGEQRG
jgi:hypothetical protein